MIGYGTDIWSGETLNTSRLDGGRGLVMRALYRRLTTVRGALEGGDEEASYGADLASFVGRSDPEKTTALISALVRAECLKDDRVAAVSADVSVDVGVGGVSLIAARVTCTLVDEEESFDFTVRVSEAGALLGVS